MTGRIPRRLRCPSFPDRFPLAAELASGPPAIYLAAAGELTDVPSRSPPRTPPYGKSQVLRLQALGDDGDCWEHGSKGDEAA